MKTKKILSIITVVALAFSNVYIPVYAEEMGTAVSVETASEAGSETLSRLEETSYGEESAEIGENDETGSKESENQSEKDNESETGSETKNESQETVTESGSGSEEKETATHTESETQDRTESNPQESTEIATESVTREDTESATQETGTEIENTAQETETELGDLTEEQETTEITEELISAETAGGKAIQAAESVETVADFTYRVEENGEITITGYNGNKGNVTIPSEIDGKKVTVIGEGAFKGGRVIGGLIIPSGVKHIESQAFYGCEGLSLITIPKSVIIIGDGAFKGCNLSYVSYGGTEKDWKKIAIGTDNEPIIQAEKSYSYNGLIYKVDKKGNITITGCDESKENVKIPSKIDGRKVTSIEEDELGGWENLKNITIPGSVKRIGDEVFQYCHRLTNVTLLEGVKFIGDGAFESCSRLTNITIPEGMTSIGHGAFFDCVNLKSITIPGSVKKIGNEVFRDCHRLTNVTLLEGVTSIAEGAFGDCDSLKSITIPVSMKYIDERAFSDCYRLADIYYGGTEDDWHKVRIEEDNEELRRARIHFTENKEETPDSDTELPEPPQIEKEISAFTYQIGEDGGIIITGYKTEDATIIIPSEIGGKKVTSISKNAFYGCTNLTNLVLPEGITNIGIGAFCGCSSLTNITIPKSITGIGDAAFYGCDSLTNIYYGGTEKDWETIITGVINEPVEWAEMHFLFNDSMYYHEENEMIAITRYMQNEADVIIPSEINGKKVTGIGDNAFYGCSNLTNITLPEDITSIGSAAFWCCSDLTGIIIPEGVTSIGDAAFCGCSSLTSIVIPEGITSLGNYLFYNCGSLTSITIPENMSFINASAFLGCDSLENIYYNGTKIIWNDLELYLDDKLTKQVKDFVKVITPET